MTIGHGLYTDTWTWVYRHLTYLGHLDMDYIVRHGLYSDLDMDYIIVTPWTWIYGLYSDTPGHGHRWTYIVTLGHGLYSDTWTWII